MAWAEISYANSLYHQNKFLITTVLNFSATRVITLWLKQPKSERSAHPFDSLKGHATVQVTDRDSKPKHETLADELNLQLMQNVSR